MGNAFKKDEDRWEMQYVKPTGLYSECHWDEKIVKKLILDRKLAPRMLGSEEGFPGSEECPICLLHYQLVNRSRCCKKPICTECFLQIKRPNSGRTTYCPFCNAHRYGVVYLGPMSEEERKKLQEEEQRVLELKIAMQAEEARIEQDRALRRLQESRSAAAVSPSQPVASSSSSSVAASQGTASGTRGQAAPASSELQPPSGPPPEFFLPESVAARQREASGVRGGSEVPAWLQGLEGVDVDELMLMQAIHLSLLDQPARHDDRPGPPESATSAAVSSTAAVPPRPSLGTPVASPASTASRALSSVEGAGRFAGAAAARETPERERERERERMLALMLGGDEAPVPRAASSADEAGHGGDRRPGSSPAGRVRRYLARMAGRGRPGDRDAFVVQAGGSEDEEEDEEDTAEEAAAYGAGSAYNYGYASDEEFFDRHGAHLLLPSDSAGRSLAQRDGTQGRAVGSGARRRVTYRRDGEEDEVGPDEGVDDHEDEGLSPIATPPFAAASGAFTGGSPQRGPASAAYTAGEGVELDEDAQLALALRLSLLTAEQEEAERRMLTDAGLLRAQSAPDASSGSVASVAAPLVRTGDEAAARLDAEAMAAGGTELGRSEREAGPSGESHLGRDSTACEAAISFPSLDEAHCCQLPRTPSPLPSPRCLEGLSPGLHARSMAFGEGPSSPCIPLHPPPSPLPMSPVRHATGSSSSLPPSATLSEMLAPALEPMELPEAEIGGGSRMQHHGQEALDAMEPPGTVLAEVVLGFPPLVGDESSPTTAPTAQRPPSPFEPLAA